MARPLRINAPDMLYHVISRGNEKKETFYESSDYKKFLNILEECCSRFRAGIHSYCLMPNHIHLLIETREANLSDLMKRLLGVYTLWFNRKHQRVGHLFQGRYKAFMVERESYLLELTRYIHMNPVQAGIVSDPVNYLWSSYRYFVNPQSAAPHFLWKEPILESFSSVEEYQAFVLERRSESSNPLSFAKGGLLLGSPEFVEKFRLILCQKERKEISQHREMLKIPAERLRVLLADEEADFQIYGLWKWGRQSQKHIGDLYSKTGSAISHAIKRLELRLIKDKAMKRKAQYYESKLNFPEEEIQLSRTDPTEPIKYQ